MNKDAIDYLLDSDCTFWQWRESGEVITWRDGKTIVFRVELLGVLRRLAEDGLPPFGALLLLLASLRDNWRESVQEPGILAGILSVIGDAGAGQRWLASALGRLDRINYLNADLRRDPAARETIAEIVFECQRDRTSVETARAVVELVERGIGAEIIRRGGRRRWPYGPPDLLRELRCLNTGLDRITAQCVEARLKTGLDQLPRAAELDLPAALRVRALLAELESDDELRGLARVARKLMAAAMLPRPVLDRDELPVGGVSDITNRGRLDQLLLSELAHDNLTLAVRVAVNEALYLRRESPNRSPPLQRVLLLDTGIRSWGVPRVFATAVALALAATSNRDTEVVAYRAQGEAVEPVDLQTRAGLTAHLAALEPSLHPGPALPAFFSQIALAKQAVESVLVTTHDVFTDHEFQQSLIQQDAPLHVATVSREGRFRLFEKSPRGCKLVREARLDLAELFAERQPVAPSLVDRGLSREVPAIFQVEPFPLRLSHRIEPQRMWRVAQRGVLALTRDRRVMFWTHPLKGAVQLTDQAPLGTLWWASREPQLDGRVQAVSGIGGTKEFHLLHLDINQYRSHVQPLDLEPGVRAICSHNGVIFAVYQRQVRVVSLETGETLRTLNLPSSLVWQRSRFFADESSEPRLWHALSFDGVTARLEPLLNQEQALNGPKLLTVFERDGVEGPLGVTTGGNLYFTSTGEVRRVKHWLSGAIQVKSVSPKGRRIVLQSSPDAADSDRGEVVVDTDSLAVRRHGDPSQRFHDLEFRDYARPTSRRHRFTHVGLSQRGLLTLTSPKQHVLEVAFNRASGQVVLRRATTAAPGNCRLTFRKTKFGLDVGFRLSCAAWDDGSQAFLDSRGLLHLKSSDPSLPEVSIVLTEGALAGWCSDGRLWGADYFLGDGDRASTSDVFERVIKGFCERLPWRA